MSRPLVAGSGALRVVRAGWATSVQDRGRLGLAHLGVGRAGAVDPAGADRIARALGLEPGGPMLETAGGLVLEALRPVTVLASHWSAPLSLRIGDTVTFDPPAGSNWVTIGVAGGLIVPELLGSSSADSLGGIVPQAMVDGLVLEVGTDSAIVPGSADTIVAPPRRHAVAVLPGPRVDWFADDAWTRLLAAEWVVEETSRVGVRLSGAVLDRTRQGELPSEGLVAGAVQVPPDGRPIVMGPDHPVTGGYPVLAVVIAADLPDVLDRPIGSRIRFVPH